MRYQSNPENLSGVTDFLSSQWQIISSYWMKQYEAAKAKLMAVIGEFLGQRQILLNLQRRIAYLQDKAEKTNSPQLRAAAVNLENQRRVLWDEQIAYEGKLQTAMEKIRLVEGSKQTAAGVGQDPVVTPAVILGIAATVIVVVGLLLAHNKKVNYLHRLVADVENKSLTPAEAAALAEQEGGGLFTGLGKNLAQPIVIGAVALGALFLFMNRRR